MPESTMALRACKELKPGETFGNAPPGHTWGNYAPKALPAGSVNYRCMKCGLIHK